jgi:RimJ/RimL family protein N-acetyltransferase
MTETMRVERGARDGSRDRRHRPVQPSHGHRARLPSRVEVRVRALERSDRDALAAMFDRLSEASRTQRFLGPKPMLSDRELARFTDVDHIKHEALAAIDTADGSIIGVARYIRSSSQPQMAEVACEIVDEWQGRGVGRRLAMGLIQRASANSIRRLTANAFSDNVAALALLRRFGFSTMQRSHGVSELELALRSTAVANPQQRTVPGVAQGDRPDRVPGAREAELPGSEHLRKRSSSPMNPGAAATK